MNNQKIINKFFIFLLLFTITTISCGTNDFFNQPIDEIKSQLLKGDYNFIKGINFNEKRMALLPQFSPGASYYFALIFQKEGYKELYYQALQVAFEKEKPPWQEEAGNLLIESYLQEYEYDKARVTAEKFLENFFSSDIANEVKFKLIQSLYWLKKDTEVLSAIATFFPDQTKWDDIGPRLKLYQAVSACRLGKKNWKQYFIALFLEFPISDVQQRAFDFISLEQDRLSMFTEEEISLFWSISLLATEDEKLAIPLIKENVTTIIKILPENSTLIREIGLAYVSINQALEGGYFLSSLASQLTGLNRINANEYAGRCFYKARNLTLAAKPLKYVADNTSDGDQRDRVLWFYLDLIFDYNRSNFTNVLDSAKSQWKDPWYFDDVLEDYILHLLNTKNWMAIVNLYGQIKEYCTKEIKLKLAYLSYRFQSLNYVKLKKYSSKELLDVLSSEPERNYYSFLASAFLNQDPPILAKINKKENQPKNPNSFSSKEKFINGFFEFGLIDTGYDRLNENPQDWDPEFLYSLLPILESRHYYKEIIRTMNHIMQIKNYELSLEDMKITYPQYYIEEITRYTQKYKVDTMFFLSLVREESAFDKDIVSAAGAIGLSQLMESTAADTARRMKLNDYNLYEADTNLHIGIYHMDQLYSRLKDFPKSMAAYNAGLSRVRSWEKQFGAYPMDIFTEMIPYDETRYYIKKILVSMVIYNSIYGGIKTPITTKRVFPSIF